MQQMNIMSNSRVWDGVIGRISAHIKLQHDRDEWMNEWLKMASLTLHKEQTVPEQIDITSALDVFMMLWL